MTRVPLAAALVLLGTSVALAATYRTDQQPGTEADVMAGASLFAEHCARCHGAEGEGMAKAAPRLRDQAFLGAVGNDFLTATVTKGRLTEDMVSWETVDSHADAGMRKKQVAQLVAFLRSWQTADGVDLDESELDGKLDRGERIYQASCQECHGKVGADAGDKIAVGIGHPAYLASASNGYLRAAFGTRCRDLREAAPNSPVPEASDYPLHYTAEARDSVLLYLREGGE